mmetsp:Transcript_17915/g.25800  ORF Transcript_17915/g.25800 Transcript_17915/m.25800 type:complete len:132 (-) Transcript_17915:2215-2610(-)
MTRQKVNTNGKCGCGCGQELEIGKSQFCFQCIKQSSGNFSSTLKECATKYRACNSCDLLKDKFVVAKGNKKREALAASDQGTVEETSAAAEATDVAAAQQPTPHQPPLLKQSPPPKQQHSVGAEFVQPTCD